jgi:hypothetical protein
MDRFSDGAHYCTSQNALQPVNSGTEGIPLFDSRVPREAIFNNNDRANGSSGWMSFLRIDWLEVNKPYIPNVGHSMTARTAILHDDYIDRLHAEVEMRLSYLQYAERSGSPVLIDDARSMLNNTLARLRHATNERRR